MIKQKLGIKYGLMVGILLTLTLFLYNENVNAASFLDQSSGFTVTSATETTTNTIEPAQLIQVGAIDIKAASLEFYSDLTGGEGPPTAYIYNYDNGSKGSLVSSCEPYPTATTKLNKCDFVNLPTLKAGNEYLIGLNTANAHIFDYFYKTFTYPVINTYLTWQIGDPNPARSYGFTKLVIIPGDQVTVMPNDEFKDYWNYNAQLNAITISIFIFIFLLLVVVTILKK